MNHPFRQVLVHLDASTAAAHRLRAARRIAQESGAVVTALYAATPSYPALMSSPEMAAGVVDALTQVDADCRALARAALERELETPGAVATWAESAEYPVGGAFVQQAYFADLLVLGQYDTSSPAAGVPPDFAATVVLDSGKPGLVIPYTGWSGTIGDTVVIAWKETRESARAVAAALPLLQRARSVHVLAWDEGAPPLVQGGRLDLRGYLALHGVNVRWHAGGAAPDALGEILLSHAFDLDADLLVMGCYGHSRARELVLGGASRTVLQSMTMPVLMAH